MSKKKSKLKLKKKAIRKLAAPELGKAQGGTDTMAWCNVLSADSGGPAPISVGTDDTTDGSLHYTNHNQGLRS